MRYNVRGSIIGLKGKDKIVHPISGKLQKLGENVATLWSITDVSFCRSVYATFQTKPFRLTLMTDSQTTLRLVEVSPTHHRQNEQTLIGQRQKVLTMRVLGRKLWESTDRNRFIFQAVHAKKH